MLCTEPKRTEGQRLAKGARTVRVRGHVCGWTSGLRTVIVDIGRSELATPPPRTSRLLSCIRHDTQLKDAYQKHCQNGLQLTTERNERRFITRCLSARSRNSKQPNRLRRRLATLLIVIRHRHTSSSLTVTRILRIFLSIYQTYSPIFLVCAYFNVICCSICIPGQG